MPKKDKPARDVLKIKDGKVTKVKINPTEEKPNITGTINKQRKGLWLELEVED